MTRWRRSVALVVTVAACTGGGTSPGTTTPLAEPHPATSLPSNVSPPGTAPADVPATVPTVPPPGGDVLIFPSTTSSTTTTTTTTLPPELPIPADVLFETGSATLQAEAAAVLEPFVERILTEFPTATIQIIGHTDSRGSEEANFRLSQRRAEAVAAFFIERGVDPARIVAQGKGESELLVPDFDADERFIPEAGARNRRVEVRVLP